MMRTLLAERFGLKIHIDTRPTSRWVLSEAESGPHLVATEGDDKLKAYVSDTTAVIKGNGTISSLIWAISGLLHSPVVDSTNLSGLYEFNLEWPVTAAEPAGISPNDPPPALSSQLFSSLGKLGLKLEYRKRVPVQYLTIDYAEKEPAEN
jgi:uncharacterized protein (TIGR03435 family)